MMITIKIVFPLFILIPAQTFFMELQLYVEKKFKEWNETVGKIEGNVVCKSGIEWMTVCIIYVW